LEAFSKNQVFNKKWKIWQFIIKAFIPFGYQLLTKLFLVKLSFF